jgi:hypothetical protein
MVWDLAVRASYRLRGTARSPDHIPLRAGPGRAEEHYATSPLRRSPQPNADPTARLAPPDDRHGDRCRAHAGSGNGDPGRVVRSGRQAREAGSEGPGVLPAFASEAYTIASRAAGTGRSLAGIAEHGSGTCSQGTTTGRSLTPHSDLVLRGCRNIPAESPFRRELHWMRIRDCSHTDSEHRRCRRLRPGRFRCPGLPHRGMRAATQCRAGHCADLPELRV